MRVVALVSGGKDSCFSMLECVRQGHEIVALANLLPALDEVDELDSHCFQTVGHQLIDALSACMGLPMYRVRLHGSSIAQSMTYTATPGDEVEDLARLLAGVKADIPDLQAVCSGAIASDYQRLRVEQVAARVGLVSLAPMWHRGQAALLDAMIDAGVHAVLIKVACLGLDPDRHLNKSLAQMRPLLHSLAQRFGVNVCGEGGEYETFTLDCPLFRRGRILLTDWAAVSTSSSTAAVGWLHPEAWRIEAKGDCVPTPDVIWLADAPDVAGAAMSIATHPCAQGGPDIRCRSSKSLVTFVCPVPDEEGEDLKPALTAALAALGAQMAQHNLGWQDAVFVRLYLADMAEFGSANAAYCAFFPQTSPASRACVQAARLRDEGLCALLEVETAPPGTTAAAARRVLHVQSVSEWAPSCIGPYSQANVYGGVLRMAGQIPLDAGSMTVLETTTRGQTQLALRHCDAVATALRNDLRGCCLTCFVFVTPDAVPSDVAAELWQHLLSAAGHPVHSSSSEDEEDPGEPPLDDYLQKVERPGRRRTWRPVVQAVIVPKLPRDVTVEVLVTSAFLGDTDEGPSRSSGDAARSSSAKGLALLVGIVNRQEEVVAALQRDLAPSSGACRGCTQAGCIGSDPPRSCEFTVEPEGVGGESLHVQAVGVWGRHAEVTVSWAAFQQGGTCAALWAVLAVLAACGLSQDSVGALRVYYAGPGSCSGRDAVQECVAAALEQLGWGDACVMLVPVLGVRSWRGDGWLPKAEESAWGAMLHCTASDFSGER